MAAQNSSSCLKDHNLRRTEKGYMKTQNHYGHTGGSTESQLAAYRVCKKLIGHVAAHATRESFFQVLAHEIKPVCRYDRLCINLYDEENKLLSLFTSADGKVVRALSKDSRRSGGTIAEIAITTGKPVIITDIANYPQIKAHPLYEAGLTSTLAIPLILGSRTMGTLHCSFVASPPDIVSILSFLSELSPVLALCLFTVLAEERLAYPPPPPAASRKEGRPSLYLPGMASVMATLKCVAGLNVPVMFTGETGTGKTYLARLLHECSRRSRGNFVKVNCPALAPTLFESEMFGHARGAFTGASAKRAGRLEMAQGGTLFLDEIAELSPEMQSKLLHVLEDQMFERVGESVPISVDVRLVSATNVNIREALAARLLRRDLFYRLSAVVIPLPPLRRRPNDIPPLAAHFMTEQARAFGMKALALPAAVMRILLDYTWPGNMRELRNVINMILIHSLTGEVTPQKVRSLLEESREEREEAFPRLSGSPADEGPAPAEDSTAYIKDPQPLTIQQMEKKHILHVLRKTNGVLSGTAGAAALLGIPRTTLQYRMKKLGISKAAVWEKDFLSGGEGG